MLRGLDGKLGEEDYVEPLEILIDSINKNNRFNAFGKIAFNHQLKSRLKVRRDLYQLHLKLIMILFYHQYPILYL